MKNKIKRASDPSSVYRTLDECIIKAPNKPKNIPRGTKKITEGDLRFTKGR